MSQNVQLLPPLPPTWQQVLGEAGLQAPLTYLQQRHALGRRVYPPIQDRFAALRETPFPTVRVVILGQDPYHGPGQAHGLSFSVPPGVRCPPSLRNILREMAEDIGTPPASHGCLTHWARQGVLLLNTVLTVEDGAPNSHAKRGWEAFTQHIVQAVSQRPGYVAFVFWGAHAQRLADQVDESRHLVIRSAHPSPLSARRGFFGSRPFSRINAFLKDHGEKPIDWTLPPP